MDDARRDLDPLAADEPNRYAVPLSTLLGGAFVALTDQVQVHPDPSSASCALEALPAAVGFDGE